MQKLSGYFAQDKSVTQKNTEYQKDPHSILYQTGLIRRPSYLADCWQTWWDKKGICYSHATFSKKLVFFLNVPIFKYVYLKNKIDFNYFQIMQDNCQSLG